MSTQVQEITATFFSSPPNGSYLEMGAFHFTNADLLILESNAN